MSFFAAFAFAAARSVAVVGKQRQTTNSSPRAPSIAKSAAGSQEALSRSLSRSESKNGSTLPRSQAKKKSTGENKEQAEESTPPPPKRGGRRASRKGTAGVHRYHPISLLLAPLAPPNSPLSTHVITRSGIFRRPLDGSSSFGLHRSSEKEIRGGLDLTFPLFLPSPQLRRWFSSFLSFSCCA